MLWRGWRGAAYSMSKKLLSSLLPFWRDWFLDIFFKKCPLSFTMVLFFHTFGGGRCFILVFLDPSSFLSLNPFPGDRFPAFFSKVSSTVHYRSLLPYFEGRGSLGLAYFLAESFTALIDSLLGGLIPYIFWKVSFVIHHCSPDCTFEAIEFPTSFKILS